jgi:hypothetical protein
MAAHRVSAMTPAFSVAPRHHMPQGGAGGAEGGGQRDVKNRVPLLVRHVHDARQAAEPDVVDEHVDPAELGRHGVDEMIDLGLIGPVAGDGERRFPGLLLEGAGGLGQAPLVPVADGNRGSLGRTPQRGSGPDAGASGRCHQDRLAGQQLMPVTRSAGRGRR